MSFCIFYHISSTGNELQKINSQRSMLIQILHAIEVRGQPRAKILYLRKIDMNSITVSLHRNLKKILLAENFRYLYYRINNKKKCFRLK